MPAGTVVDIYCLVILFVGLIFFLSYLFILYNIYSNTVIHSVTHVLHESIKTKQLKKKMIAIIKDYIH